MTKEEKEEMRLEDEFEAGCRTRSFLLLEVSRLGRCLSKKNYKKVINDYIAFLMNGIKMQDGCEEIINRNSELTCEQSRKKYIKLYHQNRPFFEDEHVYFNNWRECEDNS